MTGYQKTTVHEPTEAFERLREEFHVVEETEDGLTIIHEQGDSPVSGPVRQLIDEEFDIMDFSAGGQGIRYQRDLPEELRDEEAFEREQARATPAGEDISRDEARSIVRVLETIREREADSDHIAILDSAIDRVNELQDGEPVEDVPGDVTVEDVEAALTILEREGVEYGLNRDSPNRVLMSGLEFVERDAEHGPLPNPTA